MPFNKAQFNSSLLKNLNIAGAFFRDKMFEKIDQVKAPRRIKEHTSVEQAKQEGNSYSIDIVIDISEDAAPEAPAYEWGSGLQRTRGTPSLYPIEVKNAPNLVFWWEREQKLFVGKRLPIGHPGVEARPYINPTIKENMQEIKKIIGKDFKAAILAGTKRVEVISAKK